MQRVKDSICEFLREVGYVYSGSMCDESRVFLSPGDVEDPKLSFENWDR